MISQWVKIVLRHRYPFNNSAGWANWISSSLQRYMKFRQTRELVWVRCWNVCQSQALWHLPTWLCYIYAWKKIKTNAERSKTFHTKKKVVQTKDACDFPLRHLNIASWKTLSTLFCLNMETDSILEEGCAVCGSLCMKSNMKKMAAAEIYRRSIVC